MPECNSKDLDSLLDVSSVIDKDLNTRMKHFEEKAELLGFSKIEVPECSSRTMNPFIQDLNLNDGKNTYLLGVYFFGLNSQSCILKSDWVNFKGSRKISPWNDHGKQTDNILYIGQRHTNLKSRLRDHTFKANADTQALKLYEHDCPDIKYSITIFYRNIEKTKKMTSKIYCLVLEAIAKELFPTIIGK